MRACTLAKMELRSAALVLCVLCAVLGSTEDASGMTSHAKEFFAEVDHDNDQQLTRQELKEYFKKQNTGYSADDLDFVVGYYYKDPKGHLTDKNGDDKISWDEYVDLTVRSKKYAAERSQGREPDRVTITHRDGKPVPADEL